MENNLYEQKVLTFALDFGKKMLEAGYEIAKTQDTMERLCHHFGAIRTEFFVIPSEINSTIEFENNVFISQMREITNSSTNLFTIEKLNALSRKICSENISLDESINLLYEHIKLKPYSAILNSLGAGLGTGGFAVFFGGTLLDGFWAFCIGIFAFYLINALSSHFSKVAVSFMVSFINGVIAVIIYELGLCNNLDMVMIGAIMTMIPGMSFGNSVKDLLIGNTISGILTIINALLISVAIASGLALPVSIFAKSYILNYNVPTAPLVMLISGMIGSLGFGLLFSVDQKKLPIITIGGLITVAVFILAENLIPTNAHYYIMFTNLFASSFAFLVCEVLARKLKAPTAIFLLPFLIPLVPGGSLYRTMIYFVKGDTSNAMIFLDKAIETGLGIAIGLVLTGIVIRIIKFYLRLIKQKVKSIPSKH